MLNYSREWPLALQAGHGREPDCAAPRTGICNWSGAMLNPDVPEHHALRGRSEDVHWEYFGDAAQSIQACQLIGIDLDIQSTQIVLQLRHGAHSHHGRGHRRID